MRTARLAFAQLGYEKCTFSEIADRAGLTRPAVNHYFPNKKDLFEAVSKSTYHVVVEGGVLIAREHTTLAARLTAFLRAAAQQGSTDRSHAQFITSSVLEGFRHPELHNGAMSQLDEVREFVRDTLQDAMAVGEVRQDLDVEAVTEMLVAVMWGMGLYAGFVGTQGQLESVINQFSRLLSGSLSQATGPPRPQATEQPATKPFTHED